MYWSFKHKYSPFGRLTRSSSAAFIIFVTIPAFLFLLISSPHQNYISPFPPSSSTSAPEQSTNRESPELTKLFQEPQQKQYPASLTESDFPSGHVHDLIRRQGLSHTAFHSTNCYDALANISKLARPTNQDEQTKIIVVGVEYGSETKFFAKQRGYLVYAFEALQKYQIHLQSWIKTTKMEKNVKLFGMAAGDGKGAKEITVNYNGKQQKVPVGRIDQYVNGYVDILSADVQGMEYNVLKGASDLIQDVRGGIGMIWVELAFSEDGVPTRDLLKFLDRNNYIIFEFVAWGKPKGMERGTLLHHIGPKREHFHIDRENRRSIDDYLNTLNKVGKENYRFLQTDIVAIRRDLATNEALERVASLGQKICEEGEGSRCELRQLLREGNEKFIQ